MTTKKTKNKKVSKLASEFGRLGGRALVKKRGTAYMQEISKKAVKARWGNKEK